jgi:hypothetical protein
LPDSTRSPQGPITGLGTQVYPHCVPWVVGILPPAGKRPDAPAGPSEQSATGGRIHCTSRRPHTPARLAPACVPSHRRGFSFPYRVAGAARRSHPVARPISAGLVGFRHDQAEAPDQRRRSPALARSCRDRRTGSRPFRPA